MILALCGMWRGRWLVMVMLRTLETVNEWKKETILQWCCKSAVPVPVDVTVVGVDRQVMCCTNNKTSFPLAAAKLMLVGMYFTLKWYFLSTFSCSNSSRFIELLWQRLLVLKCPFMHFSCGCLSARSTKESVNLRVTTHTHTLIHMYANTLLPPATLSSVRLSNFIEFSLNLRDFRKFPRILHHLVLRWHLSSCVAVRHAHLFSTHCRCRPLLHLTGAGCVCVCVWR